MDAQQQSALAPGNPRIEELGEWMAAGLFIDCPNNDVSGIGTLWETLMKAHGDADGHEGFFGINLPLPDSADGFRYWAAMKMKPGADVPAGLQSMTVPAKRFAVFAFKGNPAQMPQAFEEIFKSRLTEAGLVQDLPWIELEYYPPDCMSEGEGALKCDLYVAVK